MDDRVLASGWNNRLANRVILDTSVMVTVVEFLIEGV
jgi:hypothetical protein